MDFPPRVPCPRQFRRIVLVSGGWLAAAGITAATAAQPTAISFNRDVRPILTNYCFQCHGPDDKARQAGLRLDLRDQALAPAESGAAAVVPRAPDRSELLHRVLATDDHRMPPAETGKQLSPRQIEVLRAWISAGADYQGHWAFTAPQRPELPAVQDGSWPRNAIDYFVLARLDQEGLAPAAEASKETLIRRATLDLTGLPPTPEEIDAFLADTSSDAYERLIDRLLQSPHYGERMAMQWLDFARYADSNGFQVDSSRDMWVWRDWVIRAFNDNMPFDQFTIEQLAGDLLPNPTTDQLVATGFNRNHRITGEGGSIAEEWRVETVIDRVETTGLTWLGLTLNCCRCHDHKYDPITQREFYQLFAFFNNVPESGLLSGEGQNTEPLMTVPEPGQAVAAAQLDSRVQAAAQQVSELEGRLDPAVAEWEPGFARELATLAEHWQLVEPESVVSSGGATLTRQADATWLASGTNPPHDVYTVTAPLAAGSLSGLLLEVFPDDSLPNQSLGRYPNGNFVLSGVEVEVQSPQLPKPEAARLSRADADYSQANWDVQMILDGNPGNGWAVDGNDPAKRLPRRALFVFEQPLSVADQAQLVVRLRHEALGQHNIGRFRLLTTSLPGELVKLDSPTAFAAVRAVLATPAAQRTAEQQNELRDFYRRQVDSPLRRADAALQAARQALTDLQRTFPTTMVMRELPQPREAFFLIRGQYDKRGEPVTAALPAVFPSMPVDTPLNRLGLARWIVRPDHPLTARVWVNRAWERFLGTGLVKTTENLGTQAEYPSHPELLDWLATEFVRLGWDMKALQKLILMSAAYRQASHVTPAMMERDPENRLLARGPRFRLSGETVRDQALAASGLLVRTIGGRPARPYMPDGVWDETSVYGNLRNYRHDAGDGLYRRTMYTIWKRTAAPPTLLLFDAPTRETCTVKRSRTNTPLQALALLNEITYVEAARRLGERMMRAGGATTEERLAYGFRLATARQPARDELQLLLEGWRADVERYRQSPDRARQLVSQGDSPAAGDLDAVELAAYTLAANVVLNLDEVITRE